MKKKRIPLLLVLCFIFMFAMSSCTPNTQTGDQEQVTQAPATASPTVKPTAGAEATAEIEDPGNFIAETTLTAAVPVNAKVEDITTNAFTLFLTEQTGISFDFTQLSPSDTSTQINTLMMSGELPDVFMGYDFGYAELAAYVDAGFIACLDDYIDQYGKNYYIFIEELTPTVGSVEPFVTYNGGVYAVPTADDMVTNMYAATKFRIQEQFLEALNMSMPTTLDELYTFLVSVRDNDVNGDGDSTDEIPMTGSSNHFILENAGMAYQYTDSGTFLKVNDDGTIEFIANNDLFRETVEYVKTLVDEDLLDPATFTQDTATLLTINSQGKAMIGVDASYISGNYDSSSDVFANISIIPNLESSDGYKATQIEMPSIHRALVVTSDCEQPDVAFRLFDYLLDDYVGAVARLGVEGEDWDYAAEGLTGRDGEPAWYSMIGTQVWTLASQNHIWRMTGMIHGDVMNHVAEDPESSTGKLAAAVSEYNLKNEVTGEQLPSLIMDVDTSTEYEEVKGLIVNYIKTSFAEFVLGERSLDDWDSYCDELDAMGLDRYIQMSQEAYDAMN